MNKNYTKEKTQQYLKIVIRTHGAFERSTASQFRFSIIFSLFYGEDDGVCANVQRVSPTKKNDGGW